MARAKTTIPTAHKQEWKHLTHSERMRLLANKPVSELVVSYFKEGLSNEEFGKELDRELHLWDPTNIREVQEIEKFPTKDVVLGAWRDLDRSEALMELIDNSIDAWQARKEQYPKKCHKQLEISIDIDAHNGELIYEDNAGGIPCEKLPNLVVPGFSDTNDLTHTIGSYRTGGKKAVFRLATAARIITRYWDPKEKQDDILAVQLDQEWIDNSQQYAFPYVRINTHPGINKGVTRYVLQLRKDDLVPVPWYDTPDELGKVTQRITNAYTLLMMRNPAIKIIFRKQALQPNQEFYDFSGTQKEQADIRPQQVLFRSALEYKGQTHPLEIELVLGCRTTTGVKEGKTGGIDLYGNDRLFVSHDQEIFSHLLPTGNSRNLVRGFINIKGPNVFIPWDTHKRHLNTDREIIRYLTKSKPIVTVFENWKRAYRAISRLGSGEVIAFIKKPLKPIVDARRRDLNIPHRHEMTVDFRTNRRASLPVSLHVPSVPMENRAAESQKLTLTFTLDEARAVMAYYEMSGEPTRDRMKDLAEHIKQELMERVEG